MGTTRMTDAGTCRDLLRRALRDPNAEFRDGQWEAIDALVNRREKLLVVQRTGWGKSAVYSLLPVSFATGVRGRRSSSHPCLP